MLILLEIKILWFKRHILFILDVSSKKWYLIKHEIHVLLTIVDYIFWENWNLKFAILLSSSQKVPLMLSQFKIEIFQLPQSMKYILLWQLIQRIHLFQVLNFHSRVKLSSFDRDLALFLIYHKCDGTEGKPPVNRLKWVNLSTSRHA